MTSPMPAAPPPACNAHRAAPDLLGVTSEVLAANGEIDPALARLGVGADADLDTRRGADRSLLRLARAWPLRDEARALESSLATSPLLADQALVWALDAMDGPQHRPADRTVPLEVRQPAERCAWLHEIWRTTYALDAERATEAGRWAREHLQPALAKKLPDVVRLTIQLDLREAAKLAGVSSPNRVVEVTRDLWARHSTQPEALLRVWFRLVAGPRPDFRTVPEDLVERLGRRRSAEIALEEGQLLALRLPREAAYVLDLAMRWFERCADRAGVVIAGQAAAMARGREQRMADGLADVMARIRPAYDGLRETSGGGDALPAWSQLQVLARTGDLGELAGAPLVWRPTLTRLVLCLARRRALDADPAAPTTPVSEADRAAIGWCDRTYGLQSTSGIALPADLTAWFDTARQPTATTRTETLAAFGIAALVLALWLGLLGGGFLGFRWLGGHVSPIEAIGLPWQVLLYLLTLVLLDTGIWAALRFPRALRISMAEAVRFDVQISPRGDGSLHQLPRAAITLRDTETVPRRSVAQIVSIPDGVRAAGLLIALWAFTGLRRLAGPRQVEVFAAPSDLTPLSPYQELARALPDEMRPGFAGLSRALAPGLPEVKIEVAERMHGLCWEALIAARLAPGRPVPYRFWRTAPSRAARPASGPSGGLAVGWTRRRSVAGTLERAWPGLQVSGAPDLSGLAPIPELVRELHLVGTVEETSAGLVFRVSGDPPTLASRKEPETATPVRVTEVCKAFEGLAACVLQGDPGPRDVRRESDRSAAALARTYAADLCARGVPVVIVVPPQDLALAADVVRTLGVTFGPRGVPGTETLLRAITEARSLILAAGETDDQDARESAMDLCLYCADGRRGSS